MIRKIDERACIGCGVCTPTCNEEAVDLVQREELNPPPSIPDFVAARYKAP